MPSPQDWTFQEANAALPRLRELFERLDAGSAELTPQVAAEALAADGIVLRDPERGLIDFAGRSADGRTLWLCWVRDEDEVSHWHWPEEGFAGRRPVEEVPE
jgi:hypothetical protein